MPRTSTRPGSATLVEPDEAAFLPAPERARLRARSGYYDRPEVRRILAQLVLRQLLRRARDQGLFPDDPA